MSNGGDMRPRRSGDRHHLFYTTGLVDRRGSLGNGVPELRAAGVVPAPGTIAGDGLFESPPPFTSVPLDRCEERANPLTFAPPSCVSSGWSSQAHVNQARRKYEFSTYF